MGITSVFLWDPFKFLDLIFYNEFSGQNQRTVLQNKNRILITKNVEIKRLRYFQMFNL